jgi:hypothetical protein
MGTPPDGERGSPVRGRAGNSDHAPRRCTAHPGASAPPGRVDRKRHEDDLAGAPLLARARRPKGVKKSGRGKKPFMLNGPRPIGMINACSARTSPLPRQF